MSGAVIVLAGISTDEMFIQRAARVPREGAR